MDCNYNTPDQGYSRTGTRVSAGREDAIHADASKWAADCISMATVVDGRNVHVVRNEFETRHTDGKSRRKS